MYRPSFLFFLSLTRNYMHIHTQVHSPLYNNHHHNAPRVCESMHASHPPIPTTPPHSFPLLHPHTTTTTAVPIMII